MLWDDVGDASQGKILTAILQGNEDLARNLLRRWTVVDLETLHRASYTLELLVRKAVVERRTHA